ncbi:ferredoxin [Frankia tisae]|uniref:ferredoxin n=1 Tax=Frankia tisae TaxID=2950104 RepID=UPI0021C0C811|nr:ferredoxin [Frankia tisae]
MKVTISNEFCQGHAQCHAKAPEVYELDDEGFIGAEGWLNVPAGLEDAARPGAAACPERVLTPAE